MKLRDVSPSRLAVYATAAAALLGALVPILADLDTSSTAGVVTGLAALAVVVREWLVGRRAWEIEQERTVRASLVAAAPLVAAQLVDAGEADPAALAAEIAKRLAP